MDIYVQKDGQRHGPYPEARIRQGIDAGEFKPEDLAWTTGKASWQPLSAIIALDMNIPPPIHCPSTAGDEFVQRSINGTDEPVAVKLPTVLATMPNVRSLEAANEKVLYEDPPHFSRWIHDFGKHGKAPVHTVVTDRRLKLKNNSYALDAVTSVKLKFGLEREDDFTWKQFKLYHRLAWGCGLFFLFALFETDYQMIALGCALTIFFIYLTSKWKLTDEIAKRMVSTLVLSGSGKDVSIMIDASTWYPSDDMIPKMIRAGYQANQAEIWRKQFIESRERSIVIAEAVGQAIGQKTISIPR